MEFTKEFIDAFNHAMRYEVGAFDPADPDTQAGLIATKEQRRKVGYVNIKTDRGGETKFGIENNANPGLDITNLTLEQAMEVYYKQYWLAGSCDIMPYPLNVLHFDGCVNHGVGRAIKFLQAALGIMPQTTNIGPKTKSLIASCDPKKVCDLVCGQRENFYKSIVLRDASQAVFLKGWLRRINEMRDYCRGA